MPVIATDDFNRADGAPGANWTRISNGEATIVSNHIEDSVSADSDAYYTYTAASFPLNQYSQVRLTTVGGAAFGMGAVCRASGDLGSNKQMYVAYSQTNDTTIRVKKWIENVDIPLATFTVPTVVANDVLRLEVVGNRIQVFINGVQVGYNLYDGSIYNTDPPGFLVFVDGGATSQAQIDDWEGGSIDPTVGYLKRNVLRPRIFAPGHAR